MKVLGLITEYNPFHNGHIHHIKEAKKLVNPDVTIVVMSGNFVQRGEPAIVDKWKRTDIVLEHGVDLVIELPFIYAMQSGDYFARGAVSLLHAIGVSDIVFGSESNDIATFTTIATTIKENKELYDTYVKKEMDQGVRYATACNNALSTLTGKQIITPNDLLGLCYVKEVVEHDYPITMHCIARTNAFHGHTLQNISSATAIRKGLQEQIDVSYSLPNVSTYLDEHYTLSQFFPYLQYILKTTTPHQLKTIHLVEEGIEYKLISLANTTTSMNEFIDGCTSKRYTRGRIQRMIIHILMNNSKAEILEAFHVDYIRILGMKQKGKSYLNKIKKTCNYKLVSTFGSYKHPALELEFKATKLLSCISSNPITTIEKEYKTFPILK